MSRFFRRARNHLIKRPLAVLAILLPFALAACDEDPSVRVQAVIDQPDAAEPVRIADLPVRLLPYDRDAIFDSLAAAADQPEPSIPPELLQPAGSVGVPPEPVNQRPDSAAAEVVVDTRPVAVQIDSVRRARRVWAAEAYAMFDSVVAKKIARDGREELADTTDADGVVRFRAPPGRWWVYASYVLPSQELYWNVPIEVGADSVAVPLTRGNARVRPVM